MLRAISGARVANAFNLNAERVTVPIERHANRLLGALLSFVVLLYLVVVPYDRWPGWFPDSKSAVYVLQVPSWPGSHPGPHGAMLSELRRNFTAVWNQHSVSAPPVPVYASPALTHDQQVRYRHLRKPPTPRTATSKATEGGSISVPAKYMFATVVKDISAQLPDLLNAIAVTTAFLGPERVSFSIVEGPSSDTTPFLLRDVLYPLLLHLGVSEHNIAITTDSPAVDWSKVNRIAALAELRNMAVQPLWDDNDDIGSATLSPENSETPKSTKTTESTTGVNVAAIIYLNDIFVHAADILELLHQHVVASTHARPAGITAAWDWLKRDPAYFYDIWVARTMEGDLFYPVDDVWWPNDELLANSSALPKYQTLSPFQAFAAWNGMAILNPAPFTQHGVRFRRAVQGECAASECSLLASDFWKTGYGRVQVVPAVQVAYERHVALDSGFRLRAAMRALGWSEGVPPVQYDKPVVFQEEPPELVRCNPWPEALGLKHNVWASTEWVPPYLD